MATLAALAPILLIVALMIGARWSAGAAGLAGLAAALPVALLVFGWRGPEAAGGLPWALGAVAAEAGFAAALIVWTVYPALCIHELQLASGATEVIRRGLARLSDDPRIAALLVAWFFGLFAEGAAGFGTPVALAAPILVTMGFSPARAVALALLGHAAGVSFGAVGTPVQPQVAATGLDATALAGVTAGLHAVLGWILALAVHRMARPLGGRAGLAWPMAAATAFLLPFTAIAVFVGPELPTLGGALLGGAAFALFVHRSQKRGSGQAGTAEGPSPRALRQAVYPYLALLALILLTRLVPPLREALSGLDWSWSLFGDFTGSFQPLYHPGTLLLLGLLAGGLLRGTRKAAFAEAATKAAARMPKVLLALVVMLILARLMVHAGMIEALAQAAADMLGGAWPLLAPATGALGTFVTGSATASNILLTDLQRATAAELGLPLLLMAAAQGLGAAIGNVICPHNIVAGGATVGLAGRDTGAVLRLTLPYFALHAALGGALVLALVALGVFAQ